MRRIWMLVLLFVIVSCSDNKAPTMNTKKLKSRGWLNKTRDSLSNYSFESLVEKKFKEFYNLNVLLKDYPDFKNDIESRIENFTTGRRKIFQINDSIKVVNIRQKGPFIKVSDSTDMTQVLFDVITDTEIKTDSVTAFITKKKLLIDGEEVTSTKVKFTRIVISKI
jgi:hypothetical protein